MIKMVRGYNPPPQDPGMDYAGYGVAAREMPNPVSQMRPYPTAAHRGLMRAVPALNGFNALDTRKCESWYTDRRGRRICTDPVEHGSAGGHLRGYMNGFGYRATYVPPPKNQPADPTVITDTWGLDLTKDQPRTSAGGSLALLVGVVVGSKLLGFW